MKHNQIIFSIIAAVLIFGGLYGVYKIVGGGPDQALLKKISEDRPQERTMWTKNAKHTLAVFSDHQCPACKIFHEYLSSFEDTKNENNAVTKKVSFVFHYFPLYQIHEHAFPLAYAAEAAARQGKFEEATARFFKDQVQLETVKDLKPYLNGVIKDLKLDEKKFNTDMNDGALQSVIQDDLQFGEKLEVNSTPTFYLDGEKLENMSPAALTKLLLELK
ncbi:MAG: thioredoxin domain-containing protein [Microgenomates group bacterium]